MSMSPKQRNLQTRQRLNEAVKIGIPGFIPKGEHI